MGIFLFLAVINERGKGSFLRRNANVYLETHRPYISSSLSILRLINIGVV